MLRSFLWTCVAAAVLCPIAWPEPKAGNARIEHGVLMNSGVVLRGRVSGSDTIRGTPMHVLETDFGEIRVPKKYTKKVFRPRKRSKVKTFHFQSIRVLKLKGLVERRMANGEQWNPITLEDRYKGTLRNTANALVRPGDSLRTGKGAMIELAPHKDVWLRVAANSQIAIPLQDRPVSIRVDRGSLINSVKKRPRDLSYTVQTPSRTLHVFGTTFHVTVGESETLSVKEGSVRIGKGTMVKTGQSASWTGSEKPTVDGLTEEHAKAFPPLLPAFPRDDMVYVPPGTYELSGHNPKPSDPPNKRDPVQNWTGSNHINTRVHISDFLIDRREITREELARFRVTTRGDTSALKPGGEPRKRNSMDLRRRGDPLDPRTPACEVTWDEAQAFARWCGKALPTEAQWEVAARGPEGSILPWGASLSDKFREAARWRGSVDHETLDVSGFGVRFMVSGADEWCRDVFRPDIEPWGKPIRRDGGSGPQWEYYEDIKLPKGEKNRKAKEQELNLLRVHQSRSVRGHRSSARWRMGRHRGYGRAGLGFRLVIELAPKASDTYVGPTMLVTRVVEGSNAAKAGVKVGDILAVYRSAPLSTINDLRNAIRRWSSHKGKLELRVIRASVSIELRVDPGRLGVTVDKR